MNAALQQLIAEGNLAEKTESLEFEIPNVTPLAYVNRYVLKSPKKPFVFYVVFPHPGIKDKYYTKFLFNGNYVAFASFDLPAYITDRFPKPPCDEWLKQMEYKKYDYWFFCKKTKAEHPMYTGKFNQPTEQVPGSSEPQPKIIDCTDDVIMNIENILKEYQIQR